MAQTSHHRIPHKYRAVKPVTGRLVTGVLNVLDENDLHHQLMKMGLELVHFRPLTRHLSLKEKILPNRVDTREVIKLFIMLGRLIRTGVPVVSALQKLTESTQNDTLKNVIFQVERDVSEGTALSEAMEHYPLIFSSPVIGIVAAREASGELGDAFDQAATYLKWVDEMGRRIKKALRYPMLLMGALAVVVTIMLGYVVPMVTGFITQLGRSLPPVTTTLIATADFFQAYWWGVLLTILAAGGLVRTLREMSQEFRLTTDRIIMKAPYFGPLIVKLNTVSFMQAFTVFYESGMPILECFDRATDSLRNLAFKDAFTRVRRKVSAGTPISEALAQTSIFTPTTIEMLNIGEESGRISEIVHDLVSFYNADIDDEIDRLIGMIEPAITIILALMILWIAAGVFGPIYDSFGDIGN